MGGPVIGSFFRPTDVVGGTGLNWLMPLETRLIRFLYNGFNQYVTVEYAKICLLYWNM